MYKYVFLLFAFVITTQSFTSPKSELKQQVEGFLELSVNLSDDSKAEIERIKSFLEPSDNREQAAIEFFQIWHQEQKAFGKQTKKIRKISFLKDKEMAFVEVEIIRSVTKKGMRGKPIKVKETFDMKTSWVQVKGKWLQRTKRFANSGTTEK